MGSDSGPIETYEINKIEINAQNWEEEGMSPRALDPGAQNRNRLPARQPRRAKQETKTKATQNKTKQSKNRSSIMCTICINDYGAQTTILYEYKKKKEHIVGVGDNDDDSTNEAMNKRQW